LNQVNHEGDRSRIVPLYRTQVVEYSAAHETLKKLSLILCSAAPFPVGD